MYKSIYPSGDIGTHRMCMSVYMYKIYTLIHVESDTHRICMSVYMYKIYTLSENYNS